MPRPYELSRVILTGPNGVQESIIKELHDLEVLHIIEHSKNELADIGQPLGSSNKLSEIIVRIRSVINSLGIKKGDKIAETKSGLFEIDRTSKKIADEVNKNNEELRRIDELSARNSAILNELNLIKGINLPVGAFKPYKTLDVITGFADDAHGAEYLDSSLRNVTQNFALYLNSGDKKAKKIFVVIFIEKANRKDADKILQTVGFAPVNLTSINSNGLDKNRNAAQCIREAEAQRQRLMSLRESAIERARRLAGEYNHFLLASEELLSRELEKADSPLKFAATRGAFLIKGWVPKEQLDEAIGRLEKAGKGKIFIHYENAGKKDKVPVKLKNPAYARPFEFFIDMYSFPNYREIDPTFFVFLTFPIFFGFMLGDFGYGILSFILFYCLKKKMPKGSALFNVLLLSSASSILFGLIYGEFFGLEEIGRFSIPHLISRTHSTLELMYIAIMIGIVHVNWGLIAGFVNIYKDHGLRHAMLEKGSWIVLQMGIALIALSLFEKIQIHWGIGALILIASLGMLFKGEGIKGLIEVPSILTNTLSYLRLMAIGLSSVSIAVVVNEMAEGLFHEGGMLILAGILILLVGHIFNLALGLFGSFLHSLRLHYVEFFTKFFHGGAEKYKPFGAKEE
ncbi:MAG: V-type ATP synthase subunit I [Nanoarchaeota archaeon]